MNLKPSLAVAFSVSRSDLGLRLHARANARRPFLRQAAKTISARLFEALRDHTNRLQGGGYDPLKVLTYDGRFRCCFGGHGSREPLAIGDAEPGVRHKPRLARP